MKPIFKQIRESAAKVAEQWGLANHFEVDIDSPMIAMFSGWRGRVSYLAVAHGGHISSCSVSFEPDRAKEEMLVFAQGASVERFPLQPYKLDWQARVDHAARNSQARFVSDAIYRNAKREGRV